MIFIILYSLNDDISNIDISSQIEPINERVTALETSFPAGCDTIVSGCTTYGSTPASNSPSDIVESIKTIYTDRYTEGYNAGYKIKNFNVSFSGLNTGTNGATAKLSYANLGWTTFKWCFVKFPNITPGLSYDSSPRTAGNMFISNLANAYIGESKNYFTISAFTNTYVQVKMVYTGSGDLIKAPAQTVGVYVIGK